MSSFFPLFPPRSQLFHRSYSNKHTYQAGLSGPAERERERVDEERPTDTNTLARTHARAQTPTRSARRLARSHARTQVRTHDPCTQARAQARPTPACAQPRHAGMGMHARKYTREPLGTQARTCTSLGTLPRKLLGTPICKLVARTRRPACAPPARRHAHRSASLSMCAGTRARDALAQMHL